MEKVLRDYRSRLQANSRETERIKMYIRIIAFLRLSVVVVAALIVYLFRNESVEVWGTTVLIGIVLFLSLARVHDRWFRKKEFVDCRDRIIHRELSLLEYRFDGIDGGSEFIDPSHDYSFDLDLFGERSFFAYINRTVTAVGRVALSRELLHPDLKTVSIRERQEAVEEMSCHTDFRIDFQSYGGCSGESRVDTEAIERLAGMPRFGTGRIVRWLVYSCDLSCLIRFMVNGNGRGECDRGGFHFVAGFFRSICQTGNPHTRTAQPDASIAFSLFTSVRDGGADAISVQAIV